MERVFVVLICLSVWSSSLVLGGGWADSINQKLKPNVTDCKNAKKIYRDAGYNDDGIYATEQQGMLNYLMIFIYFLNY